MKLERILLLTALLVLGPGVSAQQAVVDSSQQVDELVSKQVKKDSPGCAVGVIKSGRLVYARGYGMANLDFDIPNSSTTVLSSSRTRRYQHQVLRGPTGLLTGFLLNTSRMKGVVFKKTKARPP